MPVIACRQLFTEGQVSLDSFLPSVNETNIQKFIFLFTQVIFVCFLNLVDAHKHSCVIKNDSKYCFTAVYTVYLKIDYSDSRLL